MKSTTYFVKTEIYLSEGKKLGPTVACLPACLLTLCQLRNFLHEFNEKCFAIFDQSNHLI